MSGSLLSTAATALAARWNLPATTANSIASGYSTCAREPPSILWNRQRIRSRKNGSAGVR